MESYALTVKGNRINESYFTDSWNHSCPKFGEESSLGFDYRVFLQDEKWLLDDLYSDLATMTPEQLFRALEGLFCAAETHYNGMIHWYSNEYDHILNNNSVTYNNLIGFLRDYKQVILMNGYEIPYLFKQSNIY